MLLIGEFVPNDDRTGPPVTMLFGLNMLLHTLVGDVFMMKEYREWLKGAGFRSINTIRTPSAWVTTNPRTEVAPTSRSAFESVLLCVKLANRGAVATSPSFRFLGQGS